MSARTWAKQVQPTWNVLEAQRPSPPSMLRDDVLDEPWK
jgi:hypothetical protein